MTSNSMSYNLEKIAIWIEKIAKLLEKDLETSYIDEKLIKSIVKGVISEENSKMCEIYECRAYEQCSIKELTPKNCKYANVEEWE